MDKNEIKANKKTLKSLLKNADRITSICSRQDFIELSPKDNWSVSEPSGRVTIEIELWNVDVTLSDKGIFISKGKKGPPRPRPKPKPRVK